MLDASSQDSLAQEGRMGEAGIKRQEGRRGWLGTGAPQEGIRRATMAQQTETELQFSFIAKLIKRQNGGSP